MPISYFQSSRTPSLDELEENACHAAWRTFCQLGKRGFDLTLSNPTKAAFPQIDPPADVIRDAVTATYEASPQGLLETRKAIAQIYPGNVTPDHIQLFASTSESVGAIVKLFCTPGDEIITCTPTYPLLDCLCSLECVRLLEVPLQDCAGQWAIDFWTLEQTCSTKTRILIVVSPNNPTGHCIPVYEMDKLVHFCALRRIVLVIDEVFASYRLNDSPELTREPAAAHFNEGLLISLSGLSKVCGLPQHKLGWAVFGGDASCIQEAMQRMLFITDSTLSVSGWVQRMAPYYLQNRNIFRDACIERMHQDDAFLREFVQTHDVQWTVDRVDGGWSACIRLPGWASDEEIAVKCAENGVRVFPGSFFGYRENQPTLVVSLITPPEDFKAGIEKLAKLLKHFL